MTNIAERKLIGREAGGGLARILSEAKVEWNELEVIVLLILGESNEIVTTLDYPNDMAINLIQPIVELSKGVCSDKFNLASERI